MIIEHVKNTDTNVFEEKLSQTDKRKEFVNKLKVEKTPVQKTKKNKKVERYHDYGEDDYLNM